MRGKKLLKNIISTVSLQLVTIICGFILPSTLIRGYGSNVNGLISSITQFLGYITLLESGIGPVIKSVLYKPIAEKNKQEIENILKSSEKFFRIISYIFIIYIISLCIVFPLMMNGQFDAIFTLSLVIIISISIFAEYYFGMTYKLYLQAEQKAYVVSTIQIITTIVNTIIIVILVNIGANIQIVKLASAIVFVLRPIAQNLYVKRKYNLNLKNADANYKLKQKWDGLAQHIASVVHTNTDITILTIFMDIKEVSVYSIYSLIITGIKGFISSLISGVDALFGDMIVKKEKQKLNQFFLVYELFYFTVVTVVIACTMLLILPFISVYTTGITDVSYYRPSFAYLIVLAEFMSIIRIPYINLTYSAGHFRETMKGAWVESGVNIFLSIILVFKFGMIGVAIGTLVAMFIRTIEFIYHSSKYILERSFLSVVKRLLIVGIEITMIIIICGLIPSVNVTNYFMWLIQAIITFMISSTIVIIINGLVYRKEVKELKCMIKNNILNNKNM